MLKPKKTLFKSALAFDNRQLAICLNKIAEQKRLLTIVKSALPEAIAAGIQHCVLNQANLLLYTNAGAWASQIRFFHEPILTKLSEAGHKNIINLQVKILLPEMPPNPSTGKHWPSPIVINNLVQNQVNNDKDVLQQSLKRLSNTLKKRLNAKDV